MYIMTRYTDFIKEHAKKTNTTYHCAMCDIQKKGLYKNNKQTKPKPLKLTKGQMDARDRILERKERKSSDAQKRIQENAKTFVNISNINRLSKLQDARRIRMSDSELFRKTGSLSKSLLMV